MPDVINALIFSILKFALQLLETGENFLVRYELIVNPCLTYMQQKSPRILNDSLRKQEKQSGKAIPRSEL